MTRLRASVEDLIRFVESHVAGVVNVEGQDFCHECGEPEKRGEIEHGEDCPAHERDRLVAEVRRQVEAYR